MGVRAGFLIGYDILKTTVSAATKTILVQLGDVVNQSSIAGQAVLWQHVGFVSRPPKPVAGKNAAQALAVEGTDYNHIIATKDDRGQALAGSLADGETCLYAAGADGAGQARVLLKGDHSCNVFSKSPSTGNNTIFRLDGANETIALQSKYGSFTINASGITLTSGKAALILGADGTVTINGLNAEVLMTGIAVFSGGVATGLGPKPFGPSPLPMNPLSAALVGPTGLTGLPSSNVFISLTP